MQYLLNADGTGTEFGVPERVVLSRWRKRIKEGYTFSGARLSPTFWRALPAALGSDISTWHTLDEKEVAVRIVTWKAKKQHVRGVANVDELPAILRLPPADVVRAIIHTCKTSILEKLVARHAQLAEIKESGVPDLFLFARDARNRVCMAQFVEVKRPKEKMRPGQTAEHAFMYDLQLPVRKFVLRERPNP